MTDLQKFIDLYKSFGIELSRKKLRKKIIPQRPKPLLLCGQTQTYHEGCISTVTINCFTQLSFSMQTANLLNRDFWNN